MLFILYAMFLPVSFLISMVPGFDATAKRAVMKLFNTILTRAGITLIVTVAFSISSMLYHLSETYPFFLTAFLQVVTFAGIYFKLGDLMRMFSLQANDSKDMGQRIMRRPRMLMAARMHHMQHKISRSLSGSKTAQNKSAERTTATQRAQADHTRPNETTARASGDASDAADRRTPDFASHAADSSKNGVAGENTVHQERAHSVNLEKETLEQGGSADKGNATGSVRAFTADTGWGNDPRRNISRERPEIHRKTLAERRQEQEVQVKNRQPQTSGTALHERPVSMRQNHPKSDHTLTESAVGSPVTSVREPSFTGSHAERPNTESVRKSEPVPFEQKRSNRISQETKPSETGFSGMEHTSSGHPERGTIHEDPKETVYPPSTARPGTVILNGKEIRMEEIAREKTWTKEEPRKLIPAEYKGTSGHPLSEAAETPMKLKLLLLPLACMFLAVLSHPAVSDADCIGRQRHRRFYRELLRRGVQVSEQVEAYRSTVERYAGEYGIRDYVNVLLAIMEEESGGRGTDVMQASESLGLSPNTLDTESSIR